MTTRTLPSSEWSKLVGTELEPLAAVVDPSRMTVVVVEDDEGAVIGCWGLLTFLHAEGVWVAPQHRLKGSVARRLMTGMRQAVRDGGERMVITGSMSPEMDALIQHAGGYEIPCKHYALSMGGT